LKIGPRGQGLSSRTTTLINNCNNNNLVQDSSACVTHTNESC